MPIHCVLRSKIVAFDTPRDSHRQWLKKSSGGVELSGRMACGPLTLPARPVCMLTGDFLLMPPVALDTPV